LWNIGQELPNCIDQHQRAEGPQTAVIADLFCVCLPSGMAVHAAGLLQIELILIKFQLRLAQPAQL
jgi:hypothetical protein